MTGPLYESEYLFGIYEPGGEQLMLDAARPGWIVFSEAVGHDPDDRTGVDFSSFSDQGFGVICRINNGYEPDGTIPHSSQYTQFARRVANFVSTSRGCKIWIIGNEMNYAAERPGIVIDWTRHRTRRSGPPEEADPNRRGVPVRFNALPDFSTEIRTTRGAIVSPGEVITPELYARCYRLCRDAIHRLPGHQDDQVLVGAVAPWNTQTVYGSNPNGDWIQYFSDILEELGPDSCDGFALHTYTRGGDARLISSETTMESPFQSHHREFRAYRDFMAAVPTSMRHLPAYITETDQIEPWIDRNQAWVQQAYGEIDEWNRQTGSQLIRCLALYRWPRIDKWYIDGKQGVIEDFRAALEREYRWRFTAAKATKSVVRSVAAQPLPAYQVEWVNDHLPADVSIGEVITVTLELRNAGSETWTWGGGNPFRLGYHYYRNRRRLEMPVEKELRTDVPYDVEPGETVTVEAEVALPDEAGNYTIEFDLIQEGVAWFKEMGSPVLTRWITVEDVNTRRAEGEDDSGSMLLVPLFEDVSARLPRSGTAYARRSLAQIRYIVISHSGANPRLSLEVIGQAHVKHGYPGIVYDFVVDGSGQVYKVSELEDVADPRNDWSLHGVNVCLLGNFGSAPPPLVQLEGASRLCAWLAGQLDLGPEEIVGLGHLTHTDSPGATFYKPPNWQEMLRRQVQLRLAVLSSGADQQRTSDEQARLDEARNESETLTAQLDDAQREQEQLRLFNERLQLELADLRSQLALQPDAEERRPPIQNMVERLPRNPARYVLRSPDDVEFVVINHTGMEPGVPLQRIAESHMPDWPGILYDFCIDENGVIYQTQPLDEVVETNLPYLARAINIAFIGVFDLSGPHHAQLYAGAQLIAWLMDRFPRLSVDQIKGLSEFTDHASPGEQWLSGLTWKHDLIVAVRRASGLIDPTEVERELRGRLDEAERQVQVLQLNAVAMQEQRQRLQTDNQLLQSQLSAAQEAPSYLNVPSPAIHDIVERLPRHPVLRYERRSANKITHVAVHHTATLPSIGPSRIAELHVNADPDRGKEAWPGIGYHYFIHADGTIDQTNELETVSYHVFQHNTYTIGVAFAGSFMNGQTPTSAQIRSGAHLIAWLMQEQKIPLARVYGHREFPENVTVCPGSEWTGGKRWRDQLFARIEEVKKGIGIKSIRHYMLFWQRDYPGPLARQDFINAIGYVARFRPTLGFSLDDARNAEYVTIVGNQAGIDEAGEQLLRNSGCKVERIAGRNEDETGRMLAELARVGRRFRAFEVDF